MDLSKIIENISKSKKYKDLYIKTIERIVFETSRRYSKEKEIETNSKKVLHQIWDSYYLKQIDFKKIDAMSLEEILNFHSSTKERFPFLEEFYKQIFDITGKPKSIVDIGCGFNPLTIPYMHLEQCDYNAFDIDKEEIDFLNSYVPQIENTVNFKATVGDIFTDSFPNTDIVFLFKIIPVIELQKKGFIQEFIANQQARFFVITFPKLSIGGREKGMGEFYSNWFEETFQGQSFRKIEFPNELVYILPR